MQLVVGVLWASAALYHSRPGRLPIGRRLGSLPHISAPAAGLVNRPWGKMPSCARLPNRAGRPCTIPGQAHWAAPYMIAAGGAGSSGLPARASGRKMIISPSAAITHAPTRYKGCAKNW